VKTRHESGDFYTYDGLKLFWQRWVPPQAAEGQSLIIHHGFGEHSDRYKNILEAFEGTGITIYSYDARGHGRSAGKRGHCPGISSYVDDLELFFEFITGRFGVRLPVLLGHSMGGFVALAFTLRYSNQWHLSALALSAPALRVKLNAVMKMKKAVGSVLADLAPELTMPAGLDLKYLSHDQKVIEDYKNDPLVHGVVSASLAMDLLTGGEQLIAQGWKLKLPVFMAHGGEDGIADPTGTIDLFRNCASTDRRLRIYRGLYHEIFNERIEDREEVLSDLREWILDHMPVMEDPRKSEPELQMAPS